MNKLLLLLVSSLIALLSACVGVDIVAPEDTLQQQKLLINTSIDSIKVGDDVQLTATVINESGAPLTNANIIWSSLHPEHASVNKDGLISGISIGKAIVTAQYNELIDSISFYVGQTTVVNTDRQITFSGRNGYNVSGTGSLTKTDEQLLLQLNADFSADSGPGLFVYLSNSATSVQAGAELVALKENKGSQLYNVTEILAQNGNNTAVDLHTFNHVIIYCKPFGVIFGVGTIQN